MMVKALANPQGVPVDTLGVVLDTSEFEGPTVAGGRKVPRGTVTLSLVNWYMDGPGKGTTRVMRPSEFVEIPEG